jgi:hypothetical protein
MNLAIRLFALFGLLAVVGCSDDPLGGENSGGDFAIDVGTGLQPLYSWGAGAAVSVEVARTTNLLAVWHVASPQAQDITSPVRHGTVPAGAVELHDLADAETTLTAGVQYRITITLVNGAQTAFLIFTP